MRFDPIQLDAVEVAAFADLYDAAPPAFRAAFAVETEQLAGATILSCRHLQPVAQFRRVSGIGVEAPCSEVDVDSVVASMARRGVDYAVNVAPFTQPAAISRWLGQRGFTRGYAWMKFARDCAAVPGPATGLELRSAGVEAAAEFTNVVLGGFGMPSAAGDWIGALPGRPNWHCVLAYSGDIPIAAGAVYVRGETAWLGLGCTLPTHGRLGAQSALLSRRVQVAAEHGARIAVTETGQWLADRPSGSYRNILRAGFEEIYLRDNYVFTPAAKPSAA
jgi:hypothetical protein